MSVAVVRETLSKIVRGILNDPSTSEPAHMLAVRGVQCLYALEAIGDDAREAMLEKVSQSLLELSSLVPQPHLEKVVALRNRFLELADGSSLRISNPLVEVTVNDKSHDNFFTGVGGNMSDGGVFVATNSPLPVGTKVSLKVSLPAGKLVSQGKVSWIRPEANNGSPQPSGMGIRLSSPDLLEAEPVMRLLAQREPLEG